MIKFGDTATSEAQKNGYLKSNNSFSNPFRTTLSAHANTVNNNGADGADNPYVNNPKRRQSLFKTDRFEKQINNQGE